MSRYSRSPGASRAGTFISRPESTNGLNQRSQVAGGEASAAAVTSATLPSAGQGSRFARGAAAGRSRGGLSGIAGRGGLGAPEVGGIVASGRLTSSRRRRTLPLPERVPATAFSRGFRSQELRRPGRSCRRAGDGNLQDGPGVVGSRLGNEGLAVVARTGWETRRRLQAGPG